MPLYRSTRLRDQPLQGRTADLGRPVERARGTQAPEYAAVEVEESGVRHEPAFGAPREYGQAEGKQKLFEQLQVARDRGAARLALAGGRR